MGWKKFIPKPIRSAVTSVVTNVFNINPFVALGISLFLSWILRPKVPEIEDFGTNSFDDFERGLLVNKQSNDANIPVIYGERLTGGTRVIYGYRYGRGRNKRYN
jgi:predicted phage tail protein